MGSCIICGTSVDGEVCESHAEDVAFEFRGSRPEQLTAGRFYRGTVDGYADFGVFVNIGESVTGLLHRSKLDQRLESLDWEAGDDVFVQVTNVRDNGDVDLGWSIRQDEREFRGTLVDDPAGDHRPEREEGPEDELREGQTDGRGPESAGGPAGASRTPRRGEAAGGDESGGVDPTPDPDAAADEVAAGDPPADTADDSDGGLGETGDAGGDADRPETSTVGDAQPDQDGDGSAHVGPGAAVDPTDLPLVPIEELDGHVGEDVRLEGRIVDARQTGGPTIFELRDETGIVDCAAFVEAGVRAYPDVEVDDVVRLAGEVRTRREELQVETEALTVLEGEDRAAVDGRLADALTARARPESVELLTRDEALDVDAVGEVATEIRRAILEARPVVVRHPATADGYVAGAAVERAALPLIAGEHDESDAPYHYFDRRPLEGDVYDMDDATRDVTSMLDDRERHGEPFPLFVFAGTGTGRDSLDGMAFLDVYDAPRVVVAGAAVDDEVQEAAAAVVAPTARRTVATVAANVAAAVNPDVAADLRHLPATSYWEDPPSAYADLAREAGFEESATRRLREAIALQAYYQAYEDKRELIVDLLFDEHDAGDGRGLAEQVSEQFRTKLDAELETAEANVERRRANGATVAVLDADAYTHRFDFPPADLLLDELHRRTREEVPVAVGVGTDELRIRSTGGVDLEAVATRAREAAPEASVAVRGTHIEFLSGERDAVVDAVVDAVAAEV